jgi:hypothetical protein
MRSVSEPGSSIQGSNAAGGKASGIRARRRLAYFARGVEPRAHEKFNLHRACNQASA